MLESLLLSRKSMPVYPLSGPGSKKLLWGDEQFGYFGLLQQSELFTSNEIFQEAGLAGSDAIQLAGSTGWFKFFIEGKVVFIRQTPLVTNISWNELYQRGLIYGTYDRGQMPLASGAVETNQFVPTTKVEGSDTWHLKIRSMRAYDDLLGTTAGNNTTTDELLGIYQLYTPGNPLWKYGQFDLSQVALAGQELTQSRRSTLEHFVLTFSYGEGAITHGDYTDVDDTSNWRPVLELITAAEAEGQPMPQVVQTTEMDGFTF